MKQKNYEVSTENLNDLFKKTTLYSFKPVGMSFDQWRSQVKIGYVGMCGDLFHVGHLNIIQIAKAYSQILVVGVLTDEAIASYKRSPIVKFEDRCQIIKNIKYVDIVIPQTTLNYNDNLRWVKPDYLVHGKDWRVGIQKSVRQEAKKVLAEIGGTLIEPDCYEGISTTKIIEQIKRA